MPEKLNTNINKNNISLGQKRRLMLCRALLHNKKILILDEIFSSLDKKNIFYILISLKSLSKKADKIIIMSDHTNSIKTISDKTIKI